MLRTRAELSRVLLGVGQFLISSRTAPPPPPPPYPLKISTVKISALSSFILATSSRCSCCSTAARSERSGHPPSCARLLCCRLRRAPREASARSVYPIHDSLRPRMQVERLLVCINRLGVLPATPQRGALPTHRIKVARLNLQRLVRVLQGADP